MSLTCGASSCTIKLLSLLMQLVHNCISSLVKKLGSIVLISGCCLRAFLICFCHPIMVVSNICNTVKRLFGLLAAVASKVRAGKGKETESLIKASLKSIVYPNKFFSKFSNFNLRLSNSNLRYYSMHNIHELISLVTIWLSISAHQWHKNFPSHQVHMIKNTCR